MNPLSYQMYSNVQKKSEIETESNLHIFDNDFFLMIWFYDVESVKQVEKQWPWYTGSLLKSN